MLRSITSSVIALALVIGGSAGNACSGGKTLCQPGGGGVVEHDVNIEGGTAADLEPLRGCTEMRGALRIKDAAIADVEVLASLRVVRGPLYLVGNHALTSLSGLRSLEEVQTLLIDDNDGLASMSRAMPALRKVGSIEISNNERLADVSGMPALGAVRGSLAIRDNPALTSLDGLAALQSVGGIVDVSRNAKLTPDEVEAFARKLGKRAPPRAASDPALSPVLLSCDEAITVLAQARREEDLAHCHRAEHDATTCGEARTRAAAALRATKDACGL